MVGYRWTAFTEVQASGKDTAMEPAKRVPGPTSLVGRDQELSAISSMLAGRAMSDRALLLVGEAGVGKTALLDAAASAAAEAGHRVVRVDGVEFEADIGYSALSQAVLPHQALLDRLEGFHRDALLVALGLREGEPPDRLVVATAALRLLEIAAAASPVLVVVDDLHWVDRSTAEVFFFLARRMQGLPLGFLAAARSRASSLFGSVHIEERELAPLDADAADELLRQHFPKLRPAVRRRLLSEAAGNPLALLELPPALAAHGGASGDALPATLPLTERLQTVFAARIDSLPAATRDLLLLTSLEGTGDWQVLRRAGGDESLRHLGPAEDAGVVQLADGNHRVVFRHPLTRAAVVGRATPAERREAHRRLGQALAADPDRQAWHLGEATIAPDARVAYLLEQGARRALARGDISAVSWFFKAADLSPDAADRSRRVSEAAYLGAVRTDGAETLARMLAPLPDLERGSDEALYTVVGAAYFLLNGNGDIGTAIRLLRDALDAVDPRPGIDTPALRAALDMTASACLISGRPEDTNGYRALLDRLGAHVPPPFALWADAQFDPAHTLVPALDRIDAAIANVDSLVEPDEVMRLAVPAIWSDRAAAVRPALERLVASDAGDVAMEHIHGGKGLLWMAEFAAGDWGRARALAESARAMAEDQGRLLWQPSLDYFDAVLAAATGDDDARRQITARLVETAERFGANLCRYCADHVALVAAAGRADFEAAYRHATAIPKDFCLALWSYFDLVEAAVHTGRLAEARAHVAAVQDLHLGDISPRHGALLLAAQALAARDQRRATGVFHQAVTVPGADRWPFDHARIRLAYGEHLVRHGPPDEARAQLDLARTTFARLGAAPWLARADAATRPPQGEDAGDAALAGDLGLTEQEFEVVQLAARGMTNKQIGAELFLSPRTVGTYLFRAFPKLGVTTRAGLRDALTERTRGRLRRQSLTS
jgi:DNA-binding CsgD family transcriptional regulator